VGPLEHRRAFVLRGSDIFHRLPWLFHPSSYFSLRSLFFSGISRPHVYSRVSRTKDIPRARNVTCLSPDGRQFFLVWARTSKRRHGNSAQTGWRATEMKKLCFDLRAFERGLVSSFPVHLKSTQQGRFKNNRGVWRKHEEKWEMGNARVDDKFARLRPGKTLAFRCVLSSFWRNVTIAKKFISQTILSLRKFYLFKYNFKYN